MSAQRFALNQIVSIEETRYYEFKEIKGGNPLNTIKNTVDEYVVAFLNGEGGRIYWGIRDDRVVTGVRIDPSQHDELRRIISDKLSSIKPSVSPSAYRVELYPVYEENNDDIVPDRIVVEVVAPKPLSTDLYFTGGDEVFVKTDSGKKRLTGPEVQDEIERRIRERGFRWSRSETVIDQAGDAQFVPRKSVEVNLLYRLEGHTGAVFHLAIAPDGRTLVSAGNDSFVRMWDIGFGKEIKALGGHSYGVSCVALSSDGLVLAAGALNRARLWSIPRTEVIRDFDFPGETIFELAFNSELLAIAHKDVTLWEFQNGKQVARFGENGLGIRDVAFSHDGRFLTFIDDGLCVVNLETGHIKKIVLGESVVTALAFSPDGKRLATSWWNNKVKFGEVRIFSIESMQELKSYEGPEDVVTCLAYNYPDGSILASGSANKKIYLWNSYGRQLAQLEEHNYPIADIAFSVDGCTLVSAGSDRVIRVWSVR